MYMPKKEDLLSIQQFNDLVSKIMNSKEREEKKNQWMYVAIAVASIALIVGSVYAIYKLLKPNYLEDFEDDFDMDDDDFEDEDFEDYDEDDFEDEE